MYIIANFKQNLVEQEYKLYVSVFSRFLEGTSLKAGLKLIFCPPYLYCHLFKPLTTYSNVSLGSQDISQFTGGSHTGEISASQLSDYCTYTIIGHSERRAQQKESIQVVNRKLRNALENNLTPVVCVSKIEEISELSTLEGVLIAYEPLKNIGGSAAASNEQIEEFYVSTKLTSGIIYGGSVNSKNIAKILSLNFIEGFLVGGASLSPDHFIRLIEKLN